VEELFQELFSISPILRSNFIRKHQLLPSINSKTSFLDFVNPSVSQRLWHIQNNINNIVYCEICNNNVAIFSNIEIKKDNKKTKIPGYICCSKKCSKIKNTNSQKIVQNKQEIRDKIEKTNISRYGSKTFLSTAEGKQKFIEYCEKNHNGKHIFQTDYFKEKSKKTNIQKRGVEFAVNDKQLIEKRKISIKEKYGVAHTNLLPEVQLKRNKKLIEKYSELLKNYEIISINRKWFKLIHKKCDSNFECNYDLIRNRTLYSHSELCTVCNPLEKNYSILEKEVVEFIKNFIKVEENNKTILNGKEIDIFIPELNYAIEFNGLYYHSSLFKKNDYHLQKMLELNSKGIELLNIWEDDWIYKKEIVKSIILNKLNKNNKIYARNTKIIIVDKKEERPFLDDNHLQGYSQSTICYGLYYNEELISLMSFKKINDIWELNRFVNKINVSIVGGANKLFNHFIKENNPEKIFTFTDLSIFSGKLYEKLGMTEIGITKPNYYYFKPSEKKRYHKRNFQKKKLNIIGNETEQEHMIKNGWLKIYNCGNKKFLWKR
jgi:hypothetical protein